MKIIISQTFEKMFNKLRPFAKLKLKYSNKTLRIIVKYESDLDILFPIFITDKNDKLYGKNMVRSAVKNVIDILNNKLENDLEFDKFKIYN